MRPAYPQRLFEHGPVSQHGRAQLGPVSPLAARDHVVDGSQGELLMGEVTVQHTRMIRPQPRVPYHTHYQQELLRMWQSNELNPLPGLE